MSPRFDSPSGNSFSSGRSGGRRRNANGSSDARSRPSSNRFSRDRDVSRLRRQGEELNVSSNASNGKSFQGRRLDNDRRDTSSTNQERFKSNKGSRRFNTDKSIEISGERLGPRQSLRRRGSVDLNQVKRLSSDNFQNSSPDKEFFGDSPQKDLVWGRHATQAALESGRPIHRIWCTPELRSSSKFLQLLREAKSSGALLEEVSWARLGQLTGGAVHQGIVLQTAAAETLDLSTLIDGCSALDEPPLLLALDGLKDPQNLGAIVRSAEALGAHGLVLPQRRSAGLTGSVAKVAAGALEHLPVARVVNLNRSLEELKKSGYRIIGLAEEGDLTLSEIDLDGPLVVVTGSEEKGISLVTRRHCDQLVRIPLRGITTNLNASVATAVVLYEVARRGWMKGLSGQAPSPRMTRVKYASTKTGGGSTSPQQEEELFVNSESIEKDPFVLNSLKDPAASGSVEMEANLKKGKSKKSI